MISVYRVYHVTHIQSSPESPGGQETDGNHISAASTLPNPAPLKKTNKRTPPSPNVFIRF